MISFIKCLLFSSLLPSFHVRVFACGNNLCLFINGHFRLNKAKKTEINIRSKLLIGNLIFVAGSTFSSQNLNK